MRKRMLLYTLLIAVVPLGAFALSLNLRERPSLMIAVLSIATAIQLPLIHYSKNCLGSMVRPSNAVMQKIHTEYIPAPYEPGKFRKDVRISAMFIWATALVPALSGLTQLYPRMTAPAMMSRAMPAPNGSLHLLLVTLVVFMIGVLALPYWFRLGQASAIACEPGDGRRYQLRGFADQVEKSDKLANYLMWMIRCKKI